MADGKPIIVIKKKGGHGGHHGGAWKIAYADFVTAMMCFFMVMWLVNTASVVTKENIASYFRRPGIFETGSGTPLLMGQSGILDDAFTPTTHFKAGTQGGKNDVEVGGERGDEEGDKSSLGGEHEKGTGEGKAFAIPEVKGVLVEDIPQPTPAAMSDEEKYALEMAEGEIAEFRQAESEIKSLITGSPELQELLGVVDVKIDADGLNVEIADTEKSSMFQLGSARVLPEAEAAFSKLGTIIAKLDNTIDIVGHTDSRPFAGGDRGYSNWELSTDRANAARRILQNHGIDSTRISSVVGMADKLPRKPEDTLDPTNRRISMKIRFRMPQTSEFDSDTIKDRLTNRSRLPRKPTLPSSAPTATNSIASQVATENKVTIPTPKSEPIPSPSLDEAHVFTPKEIIKAAKRQHKDRVAVPPDVTDRQFNGKRDKIFSEIPVIGPADPFDF